MKVIRETCVAGRTIDRVVKVASGNHGGKRGPKMNVTSEQVQKNNDRYAVRELMRKLNANFKGGDLHLVLTYEDAPKKEQAKKDREAFIRKLRKAMAACGEELKYVAVTEFEHTRIHHHVVINKFDLEKVAKIWTAGFVKCSVLDDTGNYIELAEYLIKETTRTFREEGSLYKRRYSCSGNLVKPIVKREEVDPSELWDDPQPISGYYIPKDYERRYEHPVTGLEHLEYIMVALDKPRRYKIWPRGTAVSGREYYRPTYEEEQLGFM